MEIGVSAGQLAAVIAVLADSLKVAREIVELARLRIVRERAEAGKGVLGGEYFVPHATKILPSHQPCLRFSVSTHE